MTFFGEVSSSEGYDSDIPIKSIMILFKNEYCGVSYGKILAKFHEINGTTKNIKKANKYLQRNGYNNLVASVSGGCLEIKSIELIKEYQLKEEKRKDEELSRKIREIEDSANVEQLKSKAQENACKEDESYMSTLLTCSESELNRHKLEIETMKMMKSLQGNKVTPQKNKRKTYDPKNYNSNEVFF